MRRVELYAVAAIAVVAIILIVLFVSNGKNKFESPQRSTTSGAVASNGAPTLAAESGLKPRTEIADVRAGIVLYEDNLGKGSDLPNIPIGKAVSVVCVAPNFSGISSINSFYLISSAPWRGKFASANQFANGAPVGATTNAKNVDPQLKRCR